MPPAKRSPPDFSVAFYLRQSLLISNHFGEAMRVGMARDTVGKYAKAESPPTKKLSAKECGKAEVLASSLMAV